MEEELKKELADIKKILLGNGEIGVAEMARRSFTYMQHLSKTKNGLLDWTYRVAIGILLTFIAVKVGLK